MVKIKLAVVGFPYNHPTGIRNIKAIVKLSKLKNIFIDLVTVTEWKGYKVRNIKQFENKNLKIHLLTPKFFSRVSIQFRYYMKGLYKKLAQINPDIIYVINEPLAINTFLATIYSKKLKKKIMCFVWDNVFIRKILPIRIYEKFTHKNMAKIIAGSKDAIDLIAKKGYPRKNTAIIPLTGVDTSFFKPSNTNLCNELNIKKEKTCLFIGRLEEEKGIQYILDAKAILDKKGKKYIFLFIGDGKIYNILNDIAKIDKNVKIKKWVEYNDLSKAYNSGKVFLYPSVPQKFWEEQFGYSMLEAKACGIPVIASDMSGPREIIKDKEDGFIIPSKNAKELAEKVEYLMENKKIYNEFSKKSIKNAKRFDNKIIAQNLYKKLLSLHGKKK